MHINALPTLTALFRPALQWPQLFGGTRPVARRAVTAAAPPCRSLEKSQIVWLDARIGLQVSCRSGAMWLTYDGEQRDIVVEPGQPHRCDGAGRLCIYALQRGVVDFEVLAA